MTQPQLPPQMAAAYGGALAQVQPPRPIPPAHEILSRIRDSAITMTVPGMATAELAAAGGQQQLAAVEAEHFAEYPHSALYAKVQAINASAAHSAADILAAAEARLRQGFDTFARKTGQELEHKWKGEAGQAVAAGTAAFVKSGTAMVDTYTVAQLKSKDLADAVERTKQSVEPPPAHGFWHKARHLFDDSLRDEDAAAKAAVVRYLNTNYAPPVVGAAHAPVLPDPHNPVQGGGASPGGSGSGGSGSGGGSGGSAANGGHVASPAAVAGGDPGAAQAQQAETARDSGAPGGDPKAGAGQGAAGPETGSAANAQGTEAASATGLGTHSGTAGGSGGGAGAVGGGLGGGGSVGGFATAPPPAAMPAPGGSLGAGSSARPSAAGMGTGAGQSGQQGMGGLPGMGKGGKKDDERTKSAPDYLRNSEFADSMVAGLRAMPGVLTPDAAPAAAPEQSSWPTRPAAPKPPPPQPPAPEYQAFDPNERAPWVVPPPPTWDQLTAGYHPSKVQDMPEWMVQYYNDIAEHQEQEKQEANRRFMETIRRRPE